MLGNELAMDGTVPLRVMVFNILRGGDRLDLATGNFFPHGKSSAKSLDAVIAAIALAKPDIVGLEEAEGNSSAIAGKLGWFCHSRTQVISRFPLIDPPGADGAYVFVELAPGKIVAVANAHPPSDPYGPFLVRDGLTPAEVLANEAATRMPAIQTQLKVLPPLAAAGIPVFLTGDFNTPSHLDWTAAVAAVRPHVRYSLDWPMSKVMAAAGFRDSFREVHPDPVAVPGFTWTPGGPECDLNEVHDRIDWILVSGPVVTLSSEILGEVGGADVTYSVDRFPSDHRAVISTFQVRPADVPVLAAVDERRHFVGDRLCVTYRRRSLGSAHIVIVPAGAAASDAVERQSITPSAPQHGVVEFDLGRLPPGNYEAALLDDVGAVLSRSRFWLYPRDAAPQVMIPKARFGHGEAIPVTWRAAPGNRWDWLTIIPSATHDPEDDPEKYAANRRFLRSIHTAAQIEGSARFDENSQPGSSGWPIPPGQYEIRLLLDDGFRTLASSPPFKVES